MRQTETDDKVIVALADVAMRAAVDYAMTTHADLRAPGVIDRLVVALRHHVVAGFLQGRQDAREALNAGMPSVAETTLLASLRLAGITAARETLGGG